MFMVSHYTLLHNSDFTYALVALPIVNFWYSEIDYISYPFYCVNLSTRKPSK